MTYELQQDKRFILEIAKGVFPNIRDDVAIFISNPVFMGKKEKSRLRNYQVIDYNSGLLYEFTASLLTCLDGSQLLTVAKYEIHGREVVFGVSQVNGG